jgi:two-component system KDP operon response regulator KdpE
VRTKPVEFFLNETEVFMDWNVNSIANLDDGKYMPADKQQIRIASRGALPGVRLTQHPERGAALALVGTTAVNRALDHGKSGTPELDISRVKVESASSILVAIQTARNGDGLRDERSEVVTHDYSVNLISLHELIARVCIALKRNNVSDEEKVLFTVGDLQLDASRHLVQKRGRPLHLTPKEFALLHRLMMNAGKPVPHRKLLRSVWGPEYGDEREYLRTFIRQLRIKIEDNPTNPKYLLTEPNVGYRFAESLEKDSGISSTDPVTAEA